MKMKIAENIRTLRKQHSFTQEQLSEALGVTVSAVYKWESGQSVPEVKMLMELADLFEISVDTLLGYDRQNENVANRIKRIDQCMLEWDFKEAMLEVEKTLKKYPNRFEVVHIAAAAYKEIYFDTRDERAMERAIELYYNAIPLLYQNKETNICEATLLSQVGMIYIEAGQMDKGLELLKNNNVSGANHGFIGYTLAMMERTEEAKEYLYQSYWDNISNTLGAMTGLLYVYGSQNNESYRDVGKWMLDYLDSLVVDRNAITFVDRDKAMILAQMSLFAANTENYEEAEKYIRDACELAVRFDEQPDYTLQVIKFVSDWESMPPLMAGGQDVTTVSEIKKKIFEKAKQGKALDFVKKKFEDFLSAKAAE